MLVLNRYPRMQGNITIDNSSLIGTEIQKVLPADEGPWKLFYVVSATQYATYKFRGFADIFVFVPVFIFVEMRGTTRFL